MSDSTAAATSKPLTINRGPANGESTYEFHNRVFIHYKELFGDMAVDKIRGPQRGAPDHRFRLQHADQLLRLGQGPHRHQALQGTPW